MYKYLHFHRKLQSRSVINNDVSLQNALSLVSNFTLNLLTRFFHSTLGFSKPNWYWQSSTISILFVLNSFINKRFITKSTDDKSGLFNRQASVPPYSRTGIHLYIVLFQVWLLLCQEMFNCELPSVQLERRCKKIVNKFSAWCSI